jgi:hypothetical protein
MSKTYKRNDQKKATSKPPEYQALSSFFAMCLGEHRYADTVLSSGCGPIVGYMLIIVRA